MDDPSPDQSASRPAGSVPRAMFGATGHESSRVVFGAAALGRCTQERADATLEMLLRFGVNHLDTAASYADSELRLAPWLQTRRDEFFLATKTGEREGDAARAELERSLERLGVDHVDLIQLHNLVEEDDWQRAHAAGGAVEAMVQARAEGLVHHIGVTGHGLRIAGMHRRSLAEFAFDSVLLPYNFSLLDNPTYRGDVEELLTECAERSVAVQTIKYSARRRWAEADGPRFAWYEPLQDPKAVRRAAAFVLGNPQVFLNTSSDLRILEATLSAAADGATVTDGELRDDVERYAIRPLFDGGDLERI